MAKQHNHSDVEVIDKVQSIDDYNKQYKVVIHNDDFTTMDFVVEILMKYFEKDFESAYKIMLYVHKNGQAIAGLYSKEIAETKIHLVKLRAEQKEFPLQLSIEKVD